MFGPNSYRQLRPATHATLLLLAALAGGCANNPSNNDGQTVFPTPERAVEALTDAAKGSDTAPLLAMFGPDGRDILASGDPVADRRAREVFVIAVNQRWQLAETDPDRRELVIGDEKWPFPVPLVRGRDGWRFDSVAGKHEVLARRIGRNELAAIGVCETYVIAQKEYAAEARDGNPAGLYAQKVRSTPGKHDGLFWPEKHGEKSSPLGDLAAQATAEGYDPTAQVQGPRPFRGYLFRILTGQGASAKDGAKSYLVNGQMTAGFALIAYPADYGNSGIMTFIVNQEGVVHEADLGQDTPKLAGAITAYDPDARFRPVK
jgi:hypothetical protein